MRGRVMKMNEKVKALILLSIVMVAAILGNIALTTYASGNEEGKKSSQWRGPAWLASLTEEQKVMIKAKIQELREAGTSREKIRAEIRAMLEEWGINVTELRGLPLRWRVALTNEQRDEICQIAQEMKKAGASREEIKAAIDQKLQEWGINVTELQHPNLHGHHGPHARQNNGCLTFPPADSSQ
jgi:biotin operon repressor